MKASHKKTPLIQPSLLVKVRATLNKKNELTLESTHKVIHSPRYKG